MLLGKVSCSQGVQSASRLPLGASFYISEFAYASTKLCLHFGIDLQKLNQADSFICDCIIVDSEYVQENVCMMVAYYVAGKVLLHQLKWDPLKCNFFEVVVFHVVVIYSLWQRSLLC